MDESESENEVAPFDPSQDEVLQYMNAKFMESPHYATAHTLSTNNDYSPYVADFDGDDGGDILWHQPHDSERRALLWRCQPGQRDFDCDPPVVTPDRGYPIGFGGAY